MDPYREVELLPEIACPRCQRALPTLDVASCIAGCGAWVSDFAASEVLTDKDLGRDLVTLWWRILAPCPICGQHMILRGRGDGLFQGCDGHGFWLDADAIPHTGLRRGVDRDKLERKRAHLARMKYEREEREAAEMERAAQLHAKELAEARPERLIEANVDPMPTELELRIDGPDERPNYANALKDERWRGRFIPR